MGFNSRDWDGVLELADFIVTPWNGGFSDEWLADFWSNQDTINVGEFELGSGFGNSGGGDGSGPPPVDFSTIGSGGSGTRKGEWFGYDRAVTQEDIDRYNAFFNRAERSWEDKKLFLSQFNDRGRRVFIERMTQDGYSNQSWYEGSAQQQATQIRKHILAPDLFVYPDGGYWGNGRYITKNLKSFIPMAANWGIVLNNFNAEPEELEEPTFPNSGLVAEREAAAEAERQAQLEIQEEADRVAREEADRFAREEANRVAREEADRVAREEAAELARIAQEEADNAIGTLPEANDFGEEPVELVPDRPGTTGGSGTDEDPYVLPDLVVPSQTFLGNEQVDFDQFDQFFDYDVTNDFNTAGTFQISSSDQGFSTTILDSNITNEAIYFSSKAYAEAIQLLKNGTKQEIIKFFKEHPNVAKFFQANDFLFEYEVPLGIKQAFDLGEIGDSSVLEIREAERVAEENRIQAEREARETERIETERIEAERIEAERVAELEAQAQEDSVIGTLPEANDFGEVEAEMGPQPEPVIDPETGEEIVVEPGTTVLPDLVVTTDQGEYPWYPYPERSDDDWQSGAEYSYYLIDPNTGGYIWDPETGFYLTESYVFGRPINQGGIPLENLTDEIRNQKEEEHLDRVLSALTRLKIDPSDVEQQASGGNIDSTIDDRLNARGGELEGELTQEEQDEIEQGITLTTDIRDAMPETGEEIFDGGVLPDMLVTADNSNLLDNIDRSLWGDLTDQEILDLLEDGYTPYRPELYFPDNTDADIDISGGLNIDLTDLGKPDDEITSPYTPDADKLKIIANRFNGTRRAYNEWLQTDEGKGAVTSLGELINRNLSPSGEFDITNADAITDQVINTMTDGGLNGLNALAVSVNLLEGMTNTNLLDVPNMGYLINNIKDHFIDADLSETLERVIPGFAQRMLGIDAFLSGNDYPANYLAQGADFSDWLFGSTGLLREVDYGLLPSTEQVSQQEEDLLRESFGDYFYDNIYNQEGVDNYTVSKDIADYSQELADWKSGGSVGLKPEFTGSIGNINPTVGDRIQGFFDSVIDLGSDSLGFLQNLAYDFGFNQQKFLGGEIPTQLLNALIGSATGVPAGTLLNFVGEALRPSDQELSDYLYSKGIDPVTATRSDVARFIKDENPEIPEFDPITGKFILANTSDPISDENLYSGFGSNLRQNLGDLLGGDLGKLLSGDQSITDLFQNVTSGAVMELEQVANNTTEFVETILDPIDDAVVGIGGGANEIDPVTGVPVVFPTDQDAIDEHNQGVIETDADPNDGNVAINPYTQGNDEADPGLVDTNVNINTNNMDDNNDVIGSEYDVAYETAKILVGAEQAEQYRGLGLSNPDLQEIINLYASDVSQAELARLIELTRGEQTGINELREIQRQSDLDLIGQFGSDFADEVRGLDPTAMGILGEQEALAKDLYRRAGGELTAQEKAMNAERAFELSAQTGRQLDDTRIRDAMYADEDYKAQLEARASGAGTTAFNMSRNLTGDIPSMLLGTGSSPYGTGVGNVSPPLGIGDVVAAGTNSFAQQQQLLMAETALADYEQQYANAMEAGDTTTAQNINNQIVQVQNTIEAITSGIALVKEVPGIVRGFGDLLGSGINILRGNSNTAVPVSEDYFYKNNPGYNSGYGN